ncbi:MAG: rod shape-determining protein RodA [Gemmatimonadota bacterium]
MNRGLDRTLFAVVFALSVLGVIILYSAGQTDFHSDGDGKWIRQLIWLAIGVAAAAVSYRVSFRILEWAAPWAYAMGLALLVLTLAVGRGFGTGASSNSWLAIGNVRLGQPVELAKLATILMLARWFASRRDPPKTLRGMLPPVMIALIPAMLVLKQPDLGSAIVFAGILFPMLYWSGVAPSLLILLISPVISLLLAWNTALWSAWMVLLFVLLLIWRPFVFEAITVYLANSAMGVLYIVVWGKMAKHQQERLLSFLNPENYRKGPGYQAIQSKVAIGSGGWFGTGFTLGTQKRSGYIPEHWTDFVFAVVGEEFGFVGVVVVLGLLLALLFILIRIARRASDPYASLCVFGIVGLIFTHIYENIGMSVSLMPITGIPLPFFSFGGSFLVAMFLALGLAFRASGEARASSYLES